VNLRNYIRSKPTLFRLSLVVIVLALPFAFPFIAMWEAREDFISTYKVAFKAFRDGPPC
jgi:Na+/H+ antiporter NhaB